MTFLEAAQTVEDARLNELEGWRRRDEPRTLALVNDATVADQVRKALREHSTRSWSLWQKVAAATVGAVTLAGGLATLINQLHHLLG